MKLVVLLVALASPAMPALAQTNIAPRHAEIVNQTDDSVRGVFISPTNDDNWGPDRLTGALLAIGETRRFDIAATGACQFDIRIAYSQQFAEERLRADVCRNSRVVINGAGRVVSLPTPPCEGQGCRTNRFMLSYAPVRCIRAPCPPGTYLLKARGRLLAQARSLTIDGPAGRGKQFDLVSGIAVEGSWIYDHAAMSLIIFADAIRDGEWKQ